MLSARTAGRQSVVLPNVGEALMPIVHHFVRGVVLGRESRAIGRVLGTIRLCHSEVPLACRLGGS
jgi:polyribonucleotide nucleotidyltransferase